MNKALLDDARAAFGECVATRCNRDGCRAGLAGLQEHLLADMDHDAANIGNEHAKCDYILFETRGIVAVIELKRGRADVGEARRQLQAGVELLQERMGLNVETVKLVPILVQRGFRRSRRNDLSKHMIRVGRRRYRIQSMNCGAPLTKAFGKPSA